MWQGPHVPHPHRGWGTCKGNFPGSNFRINDTMRMKRGWGACIRMNNVKKQSELKQKIDSLDLRKSLTKTKLNFWVELH
jgi:hypothetical protein